MYFLYKFSLFIEVDYELQYRRTDKDFLQVANQVCSLSGFRMGFQSNQNDMWDPELAVTALGFMKKRNSLSCPAPS